MLFHQTFAPLHLIVLLFIDSKHFILSLLLTILSPPCDYFRASRFNVLSIDTALVTNFYDIMIYYDTFVVTNVGNTLETVCLHWVGLIWSI